MLDSTVYVVNVGLKSRMKTEDKLRMESWLRTRLLRNDVKVLIVQDED